MFINNRDLAVITTEWDSSNQQIGCFAVSSIIALRHQPGNLNGLPHEDLTKGYDCGSVTCTADQWRRINRWVTRGDFVTVRMTSSREYRFGFCTRQQLANRGVTDEDFAWLNAYAESADYFNPNTGAVTRLATAQEYVPQLAAGSVMVLTERRR